MHGQSYQFCQGTHPNAAARDSYLARLARMAPTPEELAARAIPREDGDCVHFGPATGEKRECLPCGGKTREKVYACAVHGDTTIQNCRKCTVGYVRRGEELGGMGPGAHPVDHWAMSFARGGQMALYDARAASDHSYHNWKAGQTCYFLGGGPSLLDVDLAPLKNAFTIAVNSVCELFPMPSVWIGADPPGDPPDRFRGVPWDLPVLKLLPRTWAGSSAAGVPAWNRPDTRFFLRNHCFAPWRFLSERTVNWGADKPFGAGRSVMLASIKLAWYLGARRIVLLGADFHMDSARPYCHSAPKDEHGCASNNDKFGMLQARLRQLRPYLERDGLTIVNATEGSRLEAFDRTTLDAELARCSS